MESLGTNRRVTVLCLVNLPPPITGAALASVEAIHAFRDGGRCEVLTFGYQRGTLHSGSFSLLQVSRVLWLTCKLIWLRLSARKIDVVYHAVSASFWGNLRDICFWIALGRTLRSRTVIHIHSGIYLKGGPGFPGWLMWLNGKLIPQLKRGIILGPTFRLLLDRWLPSDRVFEVMNFFHPSLLLPEAKIREKFSENAPVNIVFLSNLIREKGYHELLDAFLSLPKDIRGRAELWFAGEFQVTSERDALRREEQLHPNVHFLGTVKGEEKRDLLCRAHLFCLPTWYRFEGQPISILEAYASGCVVITSENGGINDVFKTGENGMRVNEDGSLKISKERLRDALADFIHNRRHYERIAVHNAELAAKSFTIETFRSRINSVVLGDPAMKSLK
jgi:glycosyltransferase involved in cell wall biosynthesis